MNKFINLMKDFTMFVSSLSSREKAELLTAIVDEMQDIAHIKVHLPESTVCKLAEKLGLYTDNRFELLNTELMMVNQELQETKDKLFVLEEADDKLHVLLKQQEKTMELNEKLLEIVNKVDKPNEVWDALGDYDVADVKAEAARVKHQLNRGAQMAVKMGMMSEEKAESAIFKPNMLLDCIIDSDNF